MGDDTYNYGPLEHELAGGTFAEPDDALETQEFYELMQAYRNAPIIDQTGVAVAYEDVKRFLREQLCVPLATAKEFIAEHVGVEPPLEHDGPEHE